MTMTAPDVSLSGLVRLAGVRAALVASESDGLAVSSVATVDVDVDAVAAFAMALLHRTRLANNAAGYGDTRFMVLDAGHGRLFVAARGDLAVVVLGDPDASTGLVRMTMQRVLERLS